LSASAASVEQGIVRVCCLGVGLERATVEEPKPIAARLAAKRSRDRRNGFGWARLKRWSEGIGIVGNLKRTIRASAKDVIADLAPPPQWIEHELCKLVTRIPAGEGWAHEIKFDGFRMHARIVKALPGC
jgi:hypothetical protein